MIIYEILPENEDLVRRYSDKNVLIHKIGTEEYYAEAVDLIASPWEYEETDMPIEEEETIDEITDPDPAI